MITLPHNSLANAKRVEDDPSASLIPWRKLLACSGPAVWVVEVIFSSLSLSLCLSAIQTFNMYVASAGVCNQNSQNFEHQGWIWILLWIARGTSAMRKLPGSCRVVEHMSRTHAHKFHSYRYKVSVLHFQHLTAEFCCFCALNNSF